MSEWLYQGKEFTSEQAEGYVGFVYLITNLSNGKKYIGQKKLVSNRKSKKVGKKPKRVKKESDWQSYWGSNGDLHEDIKVLGEKHFERKILYLCKTKGAMNYLELHEQIHNSALLRPNEYYNSYIGGRISRAHMKELIYDC